MRREAYITVADVANAEIIEKKSRFIGYISPAATEQQAEDFLQSLRSRHRDARHHVYAWQIGDNNQYQRSSDDGEPAGTGGRPVLEALKMAGLQDTVMVVVRYFGGVLLGAGGLTRAYGKAANMAINAATKIEKLPAGKFALSFDYGLLGKVENYLACQNNVPEQRVYGENVCFICSFVDAEQKRLENELIELTGGSIRCQDLGEEVWYIRII